MTITKLQKIRKMNGLTQKQLADLSGVSIRSIQHYERGEFNFENVGVHVMVSFALALRCRLSDLLDGEAAETARKWERTLYG